MTTPIGQLGAGGLSVPAKQKAKDVKGFQEATKRATGALAAPGFGGISDLSTYGSGVTPRQNAKNPSVYMGADSRIAFMPADQAAQLYYQWTAKTKSRFLSQLGLAGYDVGQLKDAQLASLWGGYVDVASKYALAGQNFSPWDVLGKDIAQRESEVAKPRTVTQTQKSYNLSTAEDAHALFQGAAQTLLGRDPTKAEIARFKATLNKYEQANPTMTTTTSDYLGQELQNQSSTTKGGVSAASQGLMAQEEAKKNPEYGAYQAATSGMNWLMEMIGGG
jgi:hypothetical protein